METDHGRDAREGSYWRTAAATLCLISPFLAPAGVPLAFAMALAAGELAADAWHRRLAARTVLVGALMMVALAVVATYAGQP